MSGTSLHYRREILRMGCRFENCACGEPWPCDEASQATKDAVTMSNADTPEVNVRLAADLTVIRPGDTVLVRMARDTPAVQLLAVAERLRDNLPDVEVLVIGGADGIDVYRPLT